MGLPDSRRESLARDITHNYSQRGIEFHRLEKIPRQMAHRENFAGNLEISENQFAWCAKPPLNLRRLVNRLLQFCILAAHTIKLISQQPRAFRGIHCRSG